jgi:hypothetical protein
MSHPSADELLIGPDGLHFTTEGDDAGLPAWTEVEEGRFMPRRIRGSCRGRALG